MWGSGWQGKGAILSGRTLPPPMKRIVILISGRGSNMEAIVHTAAEQQWPAEVV